MSVYVCVDDGIEDSQNLLDLSNSAHVGAVPRPAPGIESYIRIRDLSLSPVANPYLSFSENTSEVIPWKTHSRLFLGKHIRGYSLDTCSDFHRYVSLHGLK